MATYVLIHIRLKLFFFFFSFNTYIGILLVLGKSVVILIEKKTEKF